MIGDKTASISVRKGKQAVSCVLHYTVSTLSGFMPKHISRFISLLKINSPKSLYSREQKKTLFNGIYFIVKQSGGCIHRPADIKDMLEGILFLLLLLLFVSVSMCLCLHAVLGKLTGC